MNQMKKEALAYFRSEPFRGLLRAFRKKYESLGRTGGSIVVSSLSHEERIACARFMGITTEELEVKGRLSLEAFEKQISLTRFEGLSLIELLEVYFDEPILSKKEQLIRKENHVKKRFDSIEKKYPELKFWIEVLRRKQPATFIFYTWMEENEEAFLNWIQLAARAFNQRPSNYERLPMFSQRITQNPHAFDIDKPLGRLWIHLLSVHAGKDQIPASSEDITDLLYTYFILRDDLMNFTTCANLLAETKEGIHPVWVEADRIRLVRNVPLRELITLDRIYPDQGEKVFIVENSGVCSTLLDALPQTPMMTTFGQVRLASWRMLDLLIKEKVKLYYSGDLDPEGLKMAQTLYDRYPEHVILWRMSEADYLSSSPEVRLSNDRLKKLNSLTHPELIAVAKSMQQTKKAGYQEALVNNMIEDINRLV